MQGALTSKLTSLLHSEQQNIYLVAHNAVFTAVRGMLFNDGATSPLPPKPPLLDAVACTPPPMSVEAASLGAVARLCYDGAELLVHVRQARGLRPRCEEESLLGAAGRWLSDLLGGEPEAAGPALAAHQLPQQQQQPLLCYVVCTTRPIHSSSQRTAVEEVRGGTWNNSSAATPAAVRRPMRFPLQQALPRALRVDVFCTEGHAAGSSDADVLLGTAELPLEGRCDLLCEASSGGGGGGDGAAVAAAATDDDESCNCCGASCAAATSLWLPLLLVTPDAGAAWTETGWVQLQLGLCRCSPTFAFPRVVTQGAPALSSTVVATPELAASVAAAIALAAAAQAEVAAAAAGCAVQVALAHQLRELARRRAGAAHYLAGGFQLILWLPAAGGTTAGAGIEEAARSVGEAAAAGAFLLSPADYQGSSSAPAVGCRVSFPLEPMHRGGIAEDDELWRARRAARRQAAARTRLSRLQSGGIAPCEERDSTAAIAYLDVEVQHMPMGSAVGGAEGAAAECPPCQGACSGGPTVSSSSWRQRRGVVRRPRGLARRQGAARTRAEHVEGVEEPPTNADNSLWGRLSSVLLESTLAAAIGSAGSASGGGDNARDGSASDSDSDTGDMRGPKEAFIAGMVVQRSYRRASGRRGFHLKHWAGSAPGGAVPQVSVPVSSAAARRRDRRTGERSAMLRLSVVAGGGSTCSVHSDSESWDDGGEDERCCDEADASGGGGNGGGSDAALREQLPFAPASDAALGSAAISLATSTVGDITEPLLLLHTETSADDTAASSSKGLRLLRVTPRFDAAWPADASESDAREVLQALAATRARRVAWRMRWRMRMRKARAAVAARREVAVPPPPANAAVVWQQDGDSTFGAVVHVEVSNAPGTLETLAMALAAPIAVALLPPAATGGKLAFRCAGFEIVFAAVARHGICGRHGVLRFFFSSTPVLYSSVVATALPVPALATDAGGGCEAALSDDDGTTTDSSASDCCDGGAERMSPRSSRGRRKISAARSAPDEARMKMMHGSSSRRFSSPATTTAGAFSARQSGKARRRRQRHSMRPNSEKTKAQDPVAAATDCESDGSNQASPDAAAMGRPPPSSNTRRASASEAFAALLQSPRELSRRFTFFAEADALEEAAAAAAATPTRCPSLSQRHALLRRSSEVVRKSDWGFFVFEKLAPTPARDRRRAASVSSSSGHAPSCSGSNSESVASTLSRSSGARYSTSGSSSDGGSGGGAGSGFGGRSEAALAARLLRGSAERGDSGSGSGSGSGRPRRSSRVNVWKSNAEFS